MARFFEIVPKASDNTTKLEVLDIITEVIDTIFEYNCDSWPVLLPKSDILVFSEGWRDHLFLLEKEYWDGALHGLWEKDHKSKITNLNLENYRSYYNTVVATTKTSLKVIGPLYRNAWFI